uniref:GPI anchored serine-threonine rich protein n=2 Tax=Talaromyces marneffei PM1 TaxID=1077442 RepID=A0A093VEG2_TALMA
MACILTQNNHIFCIWESIKQKGMPCIIFENTQMPVLRYRFSSLFIVKYRDLLQQQELIKMRFSTAIATLLTVGLAAAHSRRASCAAQNILDACLATERAQLTLCEASDWDCLCEQSRSVLTCYNNCPGDSGHFGAQQTMVSYCNAASAYGTSTSTTASSHTATSAASSASSTASESTATETGTATSGRTSSTSTASGRLATSSSSAAAPVTGTLAHGGFVAALALGLGLVL